MDAILGLNTAPVNVDVLDMQDYKDLKDGLTEAKKFLRKKVMNEGLDEYQIKNAEFVAEQNYERLLQQFEEREAEKQQETK
jgi:hypothetical protein